MSNRAFIIKVKKNFNARAVEALVAQLHSWQGRVLLLAEGGYALIASLDDSKQEAVCKLPQVALIGGVEIKPRELKRIQVDSSGRRVLKQLTQQGG